mmetsp:Transcript_1436/g.6414  ORF Transcript_1436/g.6414 Transcript_1436/m.6414 type:complete len:295 (+) Transcript_1436:358-1242(+)
MALKYSAVWGLYWPSTVSGAFAIVFSANSVVVMATHRSKPSFRVSLPGLEESRTRRPITSEPVTTAASKSGLGADWSNASMHENKPTRAGLVAKEGQTCLASHFSGKPFTSHVPGVPFLAVITSHTTTAALRPPSFFSLDPAWPSSSALLSTPDKDHGLWPESSRSRLVTVVCQWAVTSSPASARRPSHTAWFVGTPTNTSSAVSSLKKSCLGGPPTETRRLGMKTPSNALRVPKTPSQRATYPLALSSSQTALNFAFVAVKNCAPWSNTIVSPLISAGLDEEVLPPGPREPWS